MADLLRWTGIPALISFYRYFRFNLPRATLAAAIGLMVGLSAVEGYLAVSLADDAAYLAAVFGGVAAGALISALALLLRRRWGWAAGSTASAIGLVAYIGSRVVALPGVTEHRFPGVQGDGAGWDHPPGTVSMGLAVLFLALHFSVVTGVNVAAPDRRDWDD